MSKIGGISSFICGNRFLALGVSAAVAFFAALFMGKTCLSAGGADVKYSLCLSLHQGRLGYRGDECRLPIAIGLPVPIWDYYCFCVPVHPKMSREDLCDRIGEASYSLLAKSHASCSADS